MSEDEQPPWAQEPAKPAQPRAVPDQPARPAQTNAVTRIPRSEQTYQAVVETFKSNRGAEARALKAMLGGDETLYQRFLATTFALLAKQSKVLDEATPISLVQAIKDAASMGLEPLTTDGGIVVYKGVAEFRPQYQGYLKRIRNSRLVSDVDVQLVYEHDTFEYGWTEKGGRFTHNPAKAERGGYWGAYAYAVMPTGFVELEVMTEADLNHVRDTFGQTHTQSGKPLPWTTSWGEMARKTVLRRLAKRLPGAAVDAILAADARADAAEREAAAEAVQPIKDELAEVRALALQAVGVSPEASDGSESKDGAQE